MSHVPNTSRVETITLRGRAYAVRRWGRVDAPMLICLHGWLDCSASFQFIVDALEENWQVIAPDWRGHGGSHRTAESYPFLQLIADLDAVLEHLTPREPARLMAHSLGGNVAMVYAGTRPERVRSLVNLEGLAPVPGFIAGTPAERLERWLAGLRKGFRNLKYTDYDKMAARLREANPRLSGPRADFLARAFSRTRGNGGFEFDVDPFEYARMPLLGHDLMVESAWPRITAPVLLMTAEQSHIYQAFAGERELLARRLALIARLERLHLDDAGHNLHHDQPALVARHAERFLLAH